MILSLPMLVCHSQESAPEAALSTLDCPSEDGAWRRYGLLDHRVPCSASSVGKLVATGTDMVLLLVFSSL